MELILLDQRLKRRKLGHLMAQRRGIAAGEGTPTVPAVGGLADVELIDLGDGPELPGGPLMPWLSATPAGAQLPYPYSCASRRIAGRRLMRVGRGLGELGL